MKQTIQYVQITCDGCGKVQVAPKDASEPLLGYHGSGVFRHHEGGGDGCNDWYACRAACIRKAVESAIERQSHPDRESS